MFNIVENLSISQYLERVGDEKRANLSLLFWEAEKIKNFMVNRFAFKFSDVRIRIKTKPAINAEGIPGIVYINEGLIDYVLKIKAPPALLELIGDYYSEDQKFTPKAYFLAWVIAHEAVHGLRFHNQVVMDLPEEQQKLYYQAFEYDADCCATAMIYRRAQETFTDLTDMQVRELTMWCVFWPLRDQYRLSAGDHPPVPLRMFYLTTKIAMMWEDPNETRSPLVSENVMDNVNFRNLYKIIFDIDEEYCKIHGEDNDFIDDFFRIIENKDDDLDRVFLHWDAICERVDSISRGTPGSMRELPQSNED